MKIHCDGGKIRLDLKARKILYELDINARRSYSQIAKKVGLSKDSVNYRIKQMEKSGLIKGYYTLFDRSKLGFYNFRVFIRFYNVTSNKEKEIIGYLMKHPDIVWLVSILGRWDITFLVWSESTTEFKRFWDDFMGKWGNYVEDKWISIVVERIQYKKAFLIGKKRDDTDPEISGGEIRELVDPKDREILKVLSINSREQAVNIAKKVKLSPKAIEYRIKRMVRDKVILSFRAIVDLSFIGVTYYKIHFLLHNMTKDKEKHLESFVRFHPNIVFSSKTIGGADFEIGINVTSIDEFHGIIEDIKNTFSDIIRNLESMEYYKEYKLMYLLHGHDEKSRNIKFSTFK